MLAERVNVFDFDGFRLEVDFIRVEDELWIFVAVEKLIAKDLGFDT